MDNIIGLLAIVIFGCGYYPECGAYAHDGITEDGPMCDSRLTRTLYMDYQFSDEQKRAISAAGYSWNTATDGRVNLTIRSDYVYCDICVVPQMKEPGNIGQQWSETGKIELLKNLSIEEFSRAITHELGHSFGLGHSTNAYANMYTTPVNIITEYDIEHFDRLWYSR